MSIEAQLREESARSDRLERTIYRVLPMVLLAITTGVSLVHPLHGRPIDVSAVVSLSLIAAVWFAVLHLVPERWRQQQPAMLLHYGVLMGLAAALVALAPWYGSFAFVGYLHASAYLRGIWHYLGIVATSMVMAGAYLGGFRFDEPEYRLPWVLLTLIGTGVGGVFGHFAVRGEQRVEQQQRALAELHEANERLQAALDENAALHAQLLGQAREAGVLDERQRMAREIHDTLAQSLAGVLTQLQAAEQTSAVPSQARRHLEQAVAMARTSLTEARRTVHAVEPELLARARLPEAIGDVAERWSSEHGVGAVLTTTGDARPMHTDVEVTLLRTAQEALTNVAKHADADQVRLTLSYMADVVTLDVRDDGVGFDPAASRAQLGERGGFGLAGMRQRVQRLAGSLAIESEPGEGTAISASVPAIPAGAGA